MITLGQWIQQKIIARGRVRLRLLSWMIIGTWYIYKGGSAPFGVQRREYSSKKHRDRFSFAVAVLWRPARAATLRQWIVVQHWRVFLRKIRGCQGVLCTSHVVGG